MSAQNPLLQENESKRLDFRLPLLVCFAMFGAWQEGVVFYSGTSFSIDGKTPLPIDIGSQPVLIAAGSICTILFMLFFQRYVVWAERIMALAALVCSLILFLPISPDFLAAVYLCTCFCCAVMTGFETAIIVNLFTLKTGLKHILCAYAVVRVIVAVLQNTIVPVPFSVFRVFILIALTLMLVFFFRLPGKTAQWPRYVKKSDNLTCPKYIFIGLYSLGGLSVLLYWFGGTVVESLPNGLTITYLSCVAISLILFILWKKLDISPIQSGLVLLGTTTIGFGLGIASFFIPQLSFAASVLLGGSPVFLVLVIIYGLIMAQMYPSRFIAPGNITIACVAMIIHMVLLEALRNNLIILYVVNFVIAVGLVILYLMLMPYLLYNFRGRTLRDIIGVVAEETEEEAAGQRAALLVKTETVKPAAPEDVSLHERRMKILMTHALSPLTRREYQLADCIMRGLRRSEIAQEMDIKPATVTQYLITIYNKFGIHRRQDLFNLAGKLEREINR